MAKPSTATENVSIVIPRPSIAVAQFPIKGTSQLIVHAWSTKAKQMILDKQQGKVVVREFKDPERDYNEARYISSEGWDGFPATGFKAAIVGGCRQVAGLPMTLAKQLLFVEADDPVTNLVRIYGEPQMREDMVRLETGVADIRYRPGYWPWRAVITVRFNANMISQEQVANLLMLAGMGVGIGEWRPSAPKSSSGNFGLWELE